MMRAELMTCPKLHLNLPTLKIVVVVSISAKKNLSKICKVRTFNICLVFLLMYNLLKQSKSFLNLWNFSLIYKRGQKKNEEDK